MAKKKRSGLGYAEDKHIAEYKTAARLAESFGREVQQQSDCLHALDGLVSANTVLGKALAHKQSAWPRVLDKAPYDNARDMIDESARWFIKKCVKK